MEYSDDMAATKAIMTIRMAMMLAMVKIKNMNNDNCHGNDHGHDGDGGDCLNVMAIALATMMVMTLGFRAFAMQYSDQRTISGLLDSDG